MNWQIFIFSIPGTNGLMAELKAFLLLEKQIGIIVAICFTLTSIDIIWFWHTIIVWLFDKSGPNSWTIVWLTFKLGSHYATSHQVIKILFCSALLKHRDNLPQLEVPAPVSPGQWACCRCRPRGCCLRWPWGPPLGKSWRRSQPAPWLWCFLVSTPLWARPDRVPSLVPPPLSQRRRACPAAEHQGGPPLLEASSGSLSGWLEKRKLFITLHVSRDFLLSVSLKPLVPHYSKHRERQASFTRQNSRTLMIDWQLFIFCFPGINRLAHNPQSNIQTHSAKCGTLSGDLQKLIDRECTEGCSCSTRCLMVPRVIQFSKILFNFYFNNLFYV